MPINSVASWIRLTSHKPQQKCIQCNSVPTDIFLSFDKTKYGENTLVNQMTENDEEDILLTGKHNMRNAEIKQNELLHMQELPVTMPTKMYMCVLQHRCSERYMLNIQQSRL